ncbi:MAG: hypothetical protein LGB66_02215 [Sulfurovum sp.]|nr:hypothetical protein [Sulfurovum sp.]
MGCPDVKIIQTIPDAKILHSKEEVKQTRYSSSIITDNMLYTLLSGSKKEVTNSWNNLFGSEGILSGFPSVRDKTMALRHYDEKNPFGKRIGDLAEGEARPIAIAINHLLSVQKSEEDLISKYKLNSTQKNFVTDIGNEGTNLDTGTHMYNTSYSNMARTIGRDILKSRGYRLIPTSQKGLKLAIREEIKLGEQALDMLDKRGLLSINENGSIVNRNFRKLDGSPDYFSQDPKSGKPTKLVSRIKTVSLNPLFPEFDYNSDNSSSLYKRPSERRTDMQTSLGKLKAVSKLVLPSNSSIPSSEPQKINEAIQDIETTEETRKVITQAQESSLKIQGFFKEVLTELKEMVDKQGIYTKTGDYLMALSDYVSGSSTSKYVFGTLDTNDLYKTYTTDMVGINQQYDKSISKLLPIVRLFDDFNYLIDSDLYYTFQTAVQNRLHVFEQTLNYQTDAYFARPILGSSKIQTLGKKDIDYMLSYLVDETKLSVDEILGKSNTEVGAELNKYIDAVNLQGDSKLSLLFGIGEAMDKGIEPIKGTKSAWELANYILAINDLRKGYDKGEVKTHFMPKPDATASGALITILQASGRTPAAAEVIRDLVLGKRVYDPTISEVPEEFSDVYQLSTKVLENELNGVKDSTKIKSLRVLTKANNKVFGLMKKIIDPDIGVISSPRELMKLPFTKFVYDQAAYNNALEISKELTSKMIDENKVPLMQEILGIKDKDKLPTGDELRIELIAKLSQKYGVANRLVNIVESSTGDKLFSDQSKALEDIHELLEEIRFSENTSYDQIRIVPPLATMEAKDINTKEGYAKAREEFGATIEKWNEAVVETGDKTLTTIKKHFPNVSSIKVLLQHMTDAAILVKSLEAVFAKPEFKNYNEGLMLNHDSIGSTTKFAQAMEVEYKQQILNVNKEYDFVQAALRELKYANSTVTDKDLKAKVATHIAEVEAELKTMIPAKQKAIGNKIIATSFGVKPKILKEVSEYKGTVKEPTKEPITSNNTNKVSTDISGFNVVNHKAYQSQAKKIVKYTIREIKDKNLAKLATVALSKNPDVNIVIDNKYNGTKSKYNLGSNTIYFGTSHSSEQIAHELIHAATAQAIETNDKFFDKVSEIYINTYQQKDKFKPEIVKLMGKLENMDLSERLHEFVSLGLTNPQFVKELKKVPMGVRIWDKFKEAFMKMLGLPVNQFNTVYGNLLGALYYAKYS